MDYQRTINVCEESMIEAETYRVDSSYKSLCPAFEFNDILFSDFTILKIEN